MRESIIKINKRHLFFRSEAGDIFKIAKRKLIQNKLDKIIIDFAQVDFISRSFIDEWLNVIEELKNKGLNVKIINLKIELTKFIEKIRETKKRIRQEIATASIAH